SVTLIGYTLHRRGARAAELERRTARLQSEHDQMARAAVAAERARIARDLHDVIGHSLSVMTVQAGAPRPPPPPPPTPAPEPSPAVEEPGRQTLAELRRLLGLLHEPPGDGASPPPPGMEQLETLMAHARAAGLPVLLTREGTPGALPAGV